MSLLLLGANGQLGARLHQQFPQAMALGRAQCDLQTLREPEAQALVANHQPHTIINAAAYTAVDAAETEHDAAMQINALAPGMLARIAAKANIPFIHFSTDYVFDGRAGPYRETSSTNPLNTYGHSKRAGEEAVLAAGGRAYIFRLQWLYDSEGKNFYTTMRRLMGERVQLDVVADQLGAPTAAAAVARAINELLPQIESGALPPGIYHLTAGGYTSWHGFACAIAQALGATTRLRPITSAEYKTNVHRPPDARLDCRALAARDIMLPHWSESLQEVAHAHH